MIRNVITAGILALVTGCNMTTITVNHYGDGDITIESPMQAEKKLSVSPEFKIGAAQ